MGDYEKSITVPVPPQRLFAYLADIHNLPEYLPRLTAVRSTGDGTYDVTAHIAPPGGPERDVEGEAWMKVGEAGRTLSWGSAGPNNYSGELDVDQGEADDSSTLTVRLHTERVEGGGIEQGLQETLAGISTAVQKAED